MTLKSKDNKGKFNKYVKEILRITLRISWKP